MNFEYLTINPQNQQLTRVALNLLGFSSFKGSIGSGAFPCPAWILSMKGEITNADHLDFDLPYF
jgi:hypothetical protein